MFGDLSGGSFGAFAEYVAVPEDSLALKPANLSFEEAEAVPSAALTALQGLRDKGQIQAGQKVLVNGACGGVGTFAGQIAKALGAEVTGVGSTKKMDLMRSIGADHVIDYQQEDFTQNGQQYDLILDTGAYRSISDYKRALTPEGTYVLVGGSTAQLLQTMLLGPWISMTGRKKMVTFIKEANKKDLLFIKELLETGKVTSAIDRGYPLGEPFFSRLFTGLRSPKITTLGGDPSQVPIRHLGSTQTQNVSDGQSHCSRCPLLACSDSYSLEPHCLCAG